MKHPTYPTSIRLTQDRKRKLNKLQELQECNQQSVFNRMIDLVYAMATGEIDSYINSVNRVKDSKISTGENDEY